MFSYAWCNIDKNVKNVDEDETKCCDIENTTRIQTFIINEPIIVIIINHYISFKMPPIIDVKDIIHNNISFKKA